MEQTLIIALSIKTKNEFELKKSYFGEHLTDHATLSEHVHVWVRKISPWEKAITLKVVDES